MVVALVLASCGPAEEEEKVAPPTKEKPVAPVEEEEVTPVEEKEMVVDALGRRVEKPKYGGVFTVVWAADIVNFDEPAMASQVLAPTQAWTNEELTTGDWLVGPSGTGEVFWQAEDTPDVKYIVGNLAESWEIVDDSTLIWHLRKGVYFHDKPPANGREFVAEDYIFSRERCLFTLTSWVYGNTTEEERAAWSARAIDKYTVEEKWYPGAIGEAWRIGGDYTFIIPREVVDEYGDMRAWENACGTGPFILTDFVSLSQATLVRNPNYWRKHPLYPEDTMPYYDGIKVLIIPDASTRLAAIRTGKVDHYRGLTADDFHTLEKTSPEIKYLKYLYTNPGLFHFRTDNPELPFYDKRVRYALSMATDKDAIGELIYGGEYEMVPGPVMPIPEMEELCVPIEDLPEEVRETFEYHPDKARQLLAEAGYPDGFNTKVVAYVAEVDLLSVIKANWEKVGVNLEIEVKEYGPYISIAIYSRHEECILGANINGTPRSMNNFRPGAIMNRSVIDDEVVNQAYIDITKAFFDWQEIGRIYREVSPYIHEQCWWIVLPDPYIYAVWQPWVKGFKAEYGFGCWNLWQPYFYGWIDQDLKEEMTGRR